MRTVVLAIVVAAAPAVARSQDLLPVSLGQEVRVSAPAVGNNVEGRVVSLSTDSLRLDRRPQSVTLGIRDLTHLQVRRRTGGSFGKSLGYGFLGGVAIGALLGSFRKPHGENIGGPVVDGLLGGVAGLLGGVIYGACCASEWIEVPIRKTS